MALSDKPSILDGWGARIIAVGVIAVCSVAISFIRFEQTASKAPKSTFTENKLNPDYVKCRDTRIAQVDNMLKEKVISQTQHTAFRTRALDTCAARFPPKAAPTARPGGPPPGFPATMRAKGLPPGLKRPGGLPPTAPKQR